MVKVKEVDNLHIPDFLKRTPGIEPEIGTRQIQIFMTMRDRQDAPKTQFREFNTVLKAQEYLGAFICKGDRIKWVSDTGGSVTLKSGIRLRLNYPYRKLMKGIEPKKRLHNITADVSKLRKLSMPGPEADPERKSMISLNKPKKKRPEYIGTNAVPLKKICADNNIDPHKARIKLRKAKLKGELPHRPSDRWEFNPEDISKVLDIIGNE